MYQLHNTRPMYFNFYASLKTHMQAHMQTMLGKEIIYICLSYGLIMFSISSCMVFIYYANVYPTHGLPMHRLTYLIVSGRVDM